MTSYEHLLAVDENRGIRANVIYTNMDDNFIGTFFGYEGGGAYAEGYFWLDPSENIIIDWDTSEIPRKFHKIIEALVDIRLSFESVDEEGELSEKINELNGENIREYDNSWEYWSENCNEHIISVLSNQWGLSIKWKDNS